MRSFNAKSFKSSSALDLKNHSQLVILSSGKLFSVLRWLSMLVAAGLTLYAATYTWNVHSIAPASAEGVGCAIMALFSIMLLTGALVTRRRSDSGVVGAYAGVFDRGVAEVLSFIPQGLSSNFRQKGMFFCLFLLAAMTSGLSAQSCANPPVHNINTGLHYCTIQAAIDAPQTVSGHTITVDAGTYQEALAMTKAVALRGPNASISPNDGVRVPEAIIDLTTGTRSIRMFSSNVSITGFEIRNSANAGAIIAGQFNEVNSNPTNVVIERNYFHDLNGSAIVHFAPPSSASWTVNDNRIENVTVGAYYGGTYGSGVQFWTGANCVVTNNVISNVAHYGVHLGNISNSTFNGNYISNCNWAAIQGFGTFNGNTFSDNELVRSSLPLSTDGIRILSAPTSITITNNYIAGYANGVLIGAGQAISGTFTLTNNNLAGNTYGLYHGGTGTVSAPCNWWGEVCSTVSQKVFGPVTLETILNSGIDTDLALRGFQPAAGTCIEVPPALVLTATPSATSCSVPTGTVSLSASGGTSPYTYGGDAISGLAAGTYSYTVTDNLGCNASATATINNETTGTPEVCDGIDNDCDGSIDEDLVFMNYYADADGDGFGNPSESVSSCTAPSGYVVDNTDCNDNDAAINPGAAEVCNGIDDNCDGLVDNDLIFLTYYVDADGDGFGSASATGVSSCSAIAGSVTNNSDCNDTPGIPMNMPYNLSSLPGYGSVTSAVFYFSPGGWAGQSVPAGKVVLGATIIAGGSIANFAVFRPAGPGESFPHYTYGSNEYGWVMQANSGQAIAGVQIEVYYADSQPNYAILSSPGTLFYNGSGGYGGLSAPAGHIVSGGGYSFNNAYSSASVSALGVAGSVWPHATIGAGEQAWIVSGPFNGNSNPGRIYLVSLTPPVNQGSAINPDAVEVCDGIDNDCDGSIDEDLVFMNYYADADGDGFGNPSESVSSCTAPSGYVVDNTDCNDNDAAINPGAAEVCDGIDNNCDGLTDALPTPITVGSASASPTLCIFAELTPITHTTAGATGIGSPSGLPPGVTALWASNTITISGTPTTAGTFNYSIPLAGGCETVNATGTITVIMLPVIISSVSSASCPGVTDGGIELSVDGTGPFTYQWSPGGAVTANLSGITDGTYSVTVTGASGCSSVSSDIVVSAAGSLVSVCEDADGDTFGNAAESTTYCSVNSLRTTTNLIVDGSFENQAALQNLPGYVPPSAPTEVWGAPWGGSNWGWSSWQPIDGNGVWTGSASIARTEEFAAGWKRARTGNVFGILKENGTLTQTFSATSDGVGTLHWYDANRASWREHDWFGRPHTYSVTVTDDLGNVQQLGTYTSVVAGGTNYSTPLPLGGYGWWTTQAKNFWFARSSADFEMVAGRTYTLTFNSEILNDDRTTFFDDISISLRSMNDIPEGFSANCSDCDDTSSSVNPGITTDLCNSIDDDCDGQIDEDAVIENYYADADGDGFGNPSESVSSCTAPSGYVVDNTDCNDNNAAINPGATEVCDGIDNDCDGVDDNGSCSTAGCTYLNAANYNPSATTDDGSCIFSGCTDPLALNFSGLANSDDGSCLYGGCTDPSATNYSAAANVNDGSCLYSGCTNPLATNYCALADVDDGSCIVPVHGCTYVAAPNYNPLATVDDGSCLCEANTCTSDVDGNGVVNVSDVLLVMSEFGLVCP